MRRQFVLRRWAVVAGLCLLLAGILTVSLGWATASSFFSPRVYQPRSGGEAADLPESPTSSAEGWQPGEAAPVAGAGPSRLMETLKVLAKRPAGPEEFVQEAWQRASEVGIYNFASDLTQIAYPARSLANVGRGPDRIEMHMEGEVDQPAHTLEFRLWQPGMGGSGGAAGALTPGSGAEARIEGDRAYLRPAGGEWQEVKDFSASFEPDNDPLAFLAGMKNVREVQGSRGVTHHVC